ncbi:uncharacterized protein N7458_001011 [Penicillium daleae]|uniref:Uncharacterized protein n=1 Tax=Penicillium daleae TaxID=63821 RepID=A0AAD6G8D4_9EURO|nr:uncharacterized protein N7458_001011 [Penicillium daleae]KAJ5465325.1 hypothetical protein N7458_001011 [Penicillium daleae]
MDRWNRDVDRIVLDAASSDPVEQPKVKTAIVCPLPYTALELVQDLEKASLRRVEALTVFPGQNE